MQAWEIWFPEIEIPFFSRKERVEFWGAIVRIKGLNKDIGPWAELEDVIKLNDKCVVGQASRVLGWGKGLIIMNMWHCLRSSSSSAKQSRSLKSKHPSDIGQWATVLGRLSFNERWVTKEMRNIGEESYYHHIECSTSNPLAAWMWKWCLNNDL